MVLFPLTPKFTCYLFFVFPRYPFTFSCFSSFLSLLLCFSLDSPLSFSTSPHLLMTVTNSPGTPNPVPCKTPNRHNVIKFVYKIMNPDTSHQPRSRPSSVRLHRCRELCYESVEEKRHTLKCQVWMVRTKF